jgi:hypothetical protein
MTLTPENYAVCTYLKIILLCHVALAKKYSSAVGPASGISHDDDDDAGAPLRHDIDSDNYHAHLSL